MHNITDKDILDAIKFLIAFLGALGALVLAAKSVAKEFGNRGKLIEALGKDVMSLQNRMDKADAERSGLRKDLDKVEEEYNSLIDRFLDRFKTTRSR